MTDDDRFAGGVLYAFKWQDGRLARIEPPPTATTPLFANGSADVEVEVRMFVGTSGLYCGDVVVRTHPALIQPTSRLSELGPEPPRTPINSAIWRALPIGGLIEETGQRVRTGALWIWDEFRDEHNRTVASAKDASSPRPGPKVLLTDELLANVVAPAHSTGGRRALRAVMDSLEAVNYPGAGPAGEVTIDQARRAVFKARDRGFIQQTTGRKGSS